jgi:hypothetical protein
VYSSRHTSQISTFNFKHLKQLVFFSYNTLIFYLDHYNLSIYFLWRLKKQNIRGGDFKAIYLCTETVIWVHISAILKLLDLSWKESALARQLREILIMNESSGTLNEYKFLGAKFILFSFITLLFTRFSLRHE